jgi:hypothetical protein
MSFPMNRFFMQIVCIRGSDDSFLPRSFYCDLFIRFVVNEAESFIQSYLHSLAASVLLQSFKALLVNSYAQLYPRDTVGEFFAAIFIFEYHKGLIIATYLAGRGRCAIK